MYTNEQKLYIEFTEKINTKLIACAGSGKTKSIIDKIIFLVSKDIFKAEEVLVLTFSKFTQQDFIRRLNDIDEDYIIERDNVKTIDSFAKKIIDKTNLIDVNLLSFKFQKYLLNTPKEELEKNKELNKIKILFIDEAQDLNLIQFNIIDQLNKKLGIIINLIGDPNQNIYQFRKSTDKYLREYEAKTFYLTNNFRSKKSIVEFSKYLRPIPTPINAINGDNGLKPILFFSENDAQVEQQIMLIINGAKEENVDLKDIAIIAPTRGRMKSWGLSNGLCFVTNILFKNRVPFKQFYEESTDESSTKLEYKPSSGHINVLTYMGSKGLEWKYVLIIDADICLINKNIFDEEKHINDQYLLYVACSRAIDNMYIFSRYRTTQVGPKYLINPWFKEIPQELYLSDFQEIIYPEVKTIENQQIMTNNVTKIIDRFNEETLDYISTLLNYETIKKEIKIMYRYKIPDEHFSSSIFLGKYVEALFHTIYSIHNILPKKCYKQIENIINSKHVLTNVNKKVTEWFDKHNTITWAEFNIKKNTFNPEIVAYIEEKFNKKIELYENTIISDPFYAKYIMKKKDWIHKIYNSYLEETDFEKIKLLVFYLIVILHSLETQHYFHVKNKGKQFYGIFDIYFDLFNKMNLYVQNLKETYIANNQFISNYGLIGEIDLINLDDEYIEIKCVQQINLKHVLQLLMYNLMRNDYNQNTNTSYKLYFMNFLRGEKITITIESDRFGEIIDIFKRHL